MAKLGDDDGIYIAESMPFLENLSDLNQLERHHCLTVAQCALLIVANNSDIQNLDEAVETYYNLAIMDISRGKLQALHPDTFLPWTQYLEMIEAGFYGDEGLDAPIVTPGWLVKLDESVRWFNTKGIDIDITGVKSDLNELRTKDKYNSPIVNETTNQEEQTNDNDWKKTARQIGIEIHQKAPRLSIDKIAKKTHAEMVRLKSESSKLKVTGRGDKMPTPETIKRHALTGIKS